MRCNDFDAHIDEMLSGVLHPDANQHMRQCERCTSHYRARASVQNGLRQLAAASAAGPSRATDRAVMDAYRKLQQRRAGGETAPAQTARLVTFPSRSLVPVWNSRTWMSGAAAAAVVLAIFGSTVRMWNNTPTVSAPVVATTPAQAARQSDAKSAPLRAIAKNASQGRLARAEAMQRAAAQTQVAQSGITSAASSPALEAKAPGRSAVFSGEGSDYGTTPNTPLAANAAPVMRLASTGAVSNVAQSASSTWPGYSNLMYCDPVVCSGPMQVVHIKVPVGQVKPNLGQTEGNAFVNAEVVVGPDGVARAIRVAN